MQTSNATRNGILHAAGAADTNIDWAIRLIAVVQVAGGLFGAGRATAIFFNTMHPFSIAVLAVYLASTVAGMLLWQQTKSGYWMSLVLQIIQIPWILTAPLAYAFVSGFGLWLGAGTEGFVRDQTMLSWFHVGRLTGWGLSADVQPWHIGINLIALASATYLIVNWPQRRSRR